MDKVQYIAWDWLESRYVDNLGNCYKTLEEIPEDIRHLVMPMKDMRPLRGEWVKLVKLT